MVHALLNYLIVLIFINATAISPAQRVITQHQATEGASSDVQPVVIRQPSGVDRDRQAAHNQWAFTSPPHPKSRIPRREAVSKAIDCGVATEQLASNMEGKFPFQLARSVSYLP